MKNERGSNYRDRFGLKVVTISLHKCVVENCRAQASEILCEKHNSELKSLHKNKGIGSDPVYAGILPGFLKGGERA